MKNFLEVENTNGSIVLVATDSISALERDGKSGNATIYLIGRAEPILTKSKFDLAWKALTTKQQAELIKLA